MAVIGVWRAADAEDEYGDPVPGEFALVEVLEALYAPSNPGEQVDVGRNQVITGGVVYVRTATRPDIRDTDQVEIEGEPELLDIDGKVGHWDGPSGYKGCQFAVKKAAG